MASGRDSLLQQGQHGRADQSPGTGLPEPQVKTSSHAVANTASDKSIQFNAEVGRRTRTSYHQDLIQHEDKSSNFDHSHRENSSPQIFLNFAHNSWQHNSPMSPVPHPRVASNSPAIQYPDFMLPTNIQPGSRQEVQGSRRIKSNSPASGLAPRSSTPMGSGTNNLTQSAADGHEVIDEIQKRINLISSFYDTLPQKLARFNRQQWISSMRKDLDAQSFTFHVNVENGELISSLRETLKTSTFLSQEISHRPGAPRFPEHTAVQDINNRLNQISKSLEKVEALSDEIVSQQDWLRRLPVRPKSGSKEFGHSSNRTKQTLHPVKHGRVGEAKKRQNLTSKRHFQNRPPEEVLRAVISMLGDQLKEFQRLCQSLQPPEPEEVSGTPIPWDIELTKAAAVMLCQALCQACPNENHHVHSVLFSLLTQEMDNNDENDNTGVQFNLAFESPGESETWFFVESTLRLPNNQSMDLDDESEAERNPEPAHRLPLTRSASRLSFSDQIRISSSHAAEEPNARFCLQYHKQAAYDLAVSLKHSDIYEHRLFYPDQPRLDLIHNGEAITLRQLLQDHDRARELKLFQKVHLAKLLAEAVLKFYSADWLSCDWNWDNILIYEMKNTLEPHLRFKLANPERNERSSEPTQMSPQSSHVLLELGNILGTIVVGPSQGRIPYDTVKEGFCQGYAEIIEVCFNMSKAESNLSDEEVQERFYAKVVIKLEDMEDFVAAHED